MPAAAASIPDRPQRGPGEATPPLPPVQPPRQPGQAATGAPLTRREALRAEAATADAGAAEAAQSGSASAGPAPSPPAPVAPPGGVPSAGGTAAEPAAAAVNTEGATAPGAHPAPSSPDAPAPASRRERRRADAPGAEEPAPKDYGRAGRNLPAAIGVGLTIGLAVIAALVFYPPAFLAIIVVGVMAALWELSNGLSRSGARVARIPTMVAGGCMVLATVLAGREALWVAFTTGAGAVLLWTIVERRQNAVKDVSLSLFALTYVALMASFVAYMAGLEGGNLLVLMFLATVIASDIGGYAAGVLLGRHPIAPRISPKKSWEGLAGSMVLSVAVGVLLATLMLGHAWWTGVVLGVCMPIFATLGDFSESMIKRDLGLKDMGTLLPGHGGIMDRLDSILPTAPVALLIFSLLPGYIDVAS